MKKTVQNNRLRDNPRHQQSIDMDPYSTSIIQQLLNSTSQWRNQDEIVKLTFKAFKDFIDLHSNQIKDLKSLITTRASKQELSTGLALKANVSDLSKIVEEISLNLDSKVSYSEMTSMLSQFAKKKEISEALMINTIKSQAQNSRNKNIEKSLQFKVLQARFDDFQKQVCKKIGSCVTLPQFQQLIKIVQQKVNISELNEVLQNRVTKQYLSTCLQKKVSKSDIDTLLAKKADVSDLQIVISSLEMKASLPTIQKLTQIIENKADRSDIIILSGEKKLIYEEYNEKMIILKNQVDQKIHEVQKQLQNNRNNSAEGIKKIEKEYEAKFRNFITTNQMNLMINQIKSEFNLNIMKIKHDLEELNKAAANQLNYENFKRELTSQINLRKRCEEKIYEEIDEVRKRVEEVSAKKFDKTDFFNFKSQLAEELDQKIETQHVQEAFNKWEIEITQKTDEDKQEIYQSIKRLQNTLTEAINQNMKEIAHISSTVSIKPERFDPNVEEIIRKNRRQIDECRKTVDVIFSELKGKLDISEYQSDLLEIRKKFDGVEREISLKANIKDVCVLADSKPNIEDVNKALKQVKTALDSKTSETDLQQIVKDQATINETLLCQNIIGRWLWQSGELRPGGLIPWQIQYANTVPDYYFWQKDKSSILVLVGGIYQITTCLFGRNAIPNLIINGEPINQKESENFSNINSVKKQIGKKKKDKQSIGHQSREYIMLPSRSRISVIVGFEGAEGFLNIKRL